MKIIQVQMLDNKISSNWWEKIIHYFVKLGDKFEISYCNEEKEEIKRAFIVA